MKKINSILFSILLLMGMLSIGYFWGLKSEMFRSKEIESAQVMMERISKVFKMVAVEGEVSEIYDYKAYQYIDIPILRKKALVRVKARVSIGYDLDKVEIVIDEVSKTIRMNNFPEPEILYVEHDLDYYDIQESIFNEFTAENLTKINARAKEYATTLIEQGPLFEKAREQKEEIMSLLSDMWRQTGWELVIEDEILQG
jgi:hypothetical protein